MRVSYLSAVFRPLAATLTGREFDTPGKPRTWRDKELSAAATRLLQGIHDLLDLILI